jgi:hypothetical protein
MVILTASINDAKAALANQKCLAGSGYGDASPVKGIMPQEEAGDEDFAQERQRNIFDAILRVDPSIAEQLATAIKTAMTRRPLVTAWYVEQDAATKLDGDGALLEKIKHAAIASVRTGTQLPDELQGPKEPLSRRTTISVNLTDALRTLLLVKPEAAELFVEPIQRLLLDEQGVGLEGGLTAGSLKAVLKARPELAEKFVKTVETITGAVRATKRGQGFKALAWMIKADNRIVEKAHLFIPKITAALHGGKCDAKFAEEAAGAFMEAGLVSVELTGQPGLED